MPDFNIDLPRHAADKVKRALDDVLELTDDPEEKLRIALLATSAPIGAAGGILAALSGCTNEKAIDELYILLRRLNKEGVDAVFASML